MPPLSTYNNYYVIRSDTGTVWRNYRNLYHLCTWLSYGSSICGSGCLHRLLGYSVLLLQWKWCEWRPDLTAGYDMSYKWVISWYLWLNQRPPQRKVINYYSRLLYIFHVSSIHIVISFIKYDILYYTYYNTVTLIHFN